MIFTKKKENKKKNKKLLYAVTIKNFESIQLCGVEMYYEFIDNLFFLEKFSRKNDYKFLVKLHPSAYGQIDILKKVFTKLEFSKEKISSAFDNILATISFSSTVIEDSLNSGCPVILLDRWKRYKHCNACTKTTKINEPIYYANNLKKLEQSIISIKKSKNINFDKVLFNPGYKKNLKKTFLNFN